MRRLGECFKSSSTSSRSSTPRKVGCERSCPPDAGGFEALLPVGLRLRECEDDGFGSACGSRCVVRGGCWSSCERSGGNGVNMSRLEKFAQASQPPRNLTGFRSRMKSNGKCSSHNVKRNPCVDGVLFLTRPVTPDSAQSESCLSLGYWQSR